MHKDELCFGILRRKGRVRVFSCDFEVDQEGKTVWFLANRKMSPFVQFYGFGKVLCLRWVFAGEIIKLADELALLFKQEDGKFTFLT